MTKTPGIQTRELWLSLRQQLEAERAARLSSFARKRGYDSTLDYFLPAVDLGLKVSGISGWGRKNAMHVVLREYALPFAKLPQAFDGYQILHLTDLHIDSLPGVEDVICDLVEPLRPDLCVMTGDYRWKSRGAYTEKVLGPLRSIVNCIAPKDGIYATLGNHDTHHVVEPLENMDVQMLINESVHIYRGNNNLLITGTDDPHAYYTQQALHALQGEEGDFKLALIHSPEMYREAAAAGYDLYLSGHTHAGQICLPGGYPVVRHLNKGKDLYRGFWREADMLGYTSSGCGVSGIPVRFNTQGEVTLFTLRKA